MAISISNLSVEFKGGVRAVDDFSLTINEEEVCTICGPAGCGKTVIIDALSGQSKATIRGSVKIGSNEYPAASFSKAPFVGDSLIQERMKMTVNSFLMTPVKGKATRSVTDSLARESARVFAIDEYLQRTLTQLSGFQRLRVFLAFAFAHDYKLILIDSANMEIDGKLWNSFMAELHLALKGRNIAVICTMHGSDRFKDMGDRLVIMKNGKVQASGDTIDVLQEPKNLFVANMVWGGVCRMPYEDCLTKIHPQMAQFKGKDIIFNPNLIDIYEKGQPDTAIPAVVERTAQSLQGCHVYFRIGEHELSAVSRVHFDLARDDKIFVRFLPQGVYSIDEEDAIHHIFGFRK